MHDVSGYTFAMKTFQARVEGGRVVVDDTVEYSDGTTLRLVVADEVDELEPEERAALHDALRRAWRRVEDGQAEPIDGLLEELRSR